MVSLYLGEDAFLGSHEIGTYAQFRFSSCKGFLLPPHPQVISPVSRKRFARSPAGSMKQYPLSILKSPTRATYESLLEGSRLCSDVKNTPPLHIEPVAALRADDANEHVATSRTAHYCSHAAHIDGERTNRPGGAAMSTRFLNERHFKRENFSQDAACGIPIECRIVHLGTSCRTETLRFDAYRLISQRQQICCSCFDERCRATDVGERMLLHRPGDISQELGVDATAVARPSWRLRPG